MHNIPFLSFILKKYLILKIVYQYTEVGLVKKYNRPFSRLTTINVFMNSHICEQLDDNRNTSCYVMVCKTNTSWGI